MQAKKLQLKYYTTDVELQQELKIKNTTTFQNKRKGKVREVADFALIKTDRIWTDCSPFVQAFSMNPFH